MSNIAKINKEEDFKHIRQAGRYWTGSFVRLTMLKTQLGLIRVGIVVSKKVDNKAVIRNKLRRRINAILKEELVGREKSYDLIVSVLPKMNEVTFQELSDEVKKGLSVLERFYEKNSA